TDSLAAMGFTLPVVMVIGSASMGISLGAGSVLSRAMGGGDHYLMTRTATDGILLSMLLVGFISLAGVFSLDILFTLLGASGEVLVQVKEYMFVWYLGSMAVMMPPVSDSCLRATGDMIRPLIVMLVCAGMNFILDPILIFGYFGFPAMGIKGAALATVISRCFGMVTTLGFLHFHAGLLDLSPPHLKEIRASWGRILHVGIPASMTLLLPPLTRGLLTKMVASAGGALAVAALAAGSRIESIANILIMSVSMALVPLVGQNWGAEKWRRIHSIRFLILKMSLIYGALVFAGVWFLAMPAARSFSQDSQVISHTVLYLRILAMSTGGLCYFTWISQSLNAAGKPHSSARLNIISSLVLILPLSYLGSRIYGFTGIIFGFSLGQILSALWAYLEGYMNMDLKFKAAL
ncbi:MATE family efflux transporter, partial [Oceanispirochaeta sp.]|uniref:MATE family efflux transporter n=1 Tax=Oceanispirochaeta sp. TaxID=2035350 RepID=UPI00262CF923